MLLRADPTYHLVAETISPPLGRLALRQATSVRNQASEGDQDTVCLLLFRDMTQRLNRKTMCVRVPPGVPRLPLKQQQGRCLSHHIRAMRAICRLPSSRRARHPHRMRMADSIQTTKGVHITINIAQEAQTMCRITRGATGTLRRMPNTCMKKLISIATPCGAVRACVMRHGSHSKRRQRDNTRRRRGDVRRACLDPLSQRAALVDRRVDTERAMTPVSTRRCRVLLAWASMDTRMA